MTREELEVRVKNDSYIVERQKLSTYEVTLHLKEVNHRCPLCGKQLISRTQKKTNKMYEIAHIYPNSPTPEQYEALNGLPRLGKSTEDSENKIALCKDCHAAQDYHTTKDDYLALFHKKQELQRAANLENVAAELSLEDRIADIVERLCKLEDQDFANINYSPITIAKKFLPSDRMLKAKVASYVTEFYPFIRDLFREMEGQNGFRTEVICMQVKCCFIKMADITECKEEIFAKMVDWLKVKTQCNSISACEAVISFFVQNCEVFNEIT